MNILRSSSSSGATIPTCGERRPSETRSKKVGSPKMNTKKSPANCIPDDYSQLSIPELIELICALAEEVELRVMEELNQ